jgi:hypothetical protein
MHVFLKGHEMTAVSDIIHLNSVLKFPAGGQLENDLCILLNQMILLAAEQRGIKFDYFSSAALRR